MTSHEAGKGDRDRSNRRAFERGYTNIRWSTPVTKPSAHAEIVWYVFTALLWSTTVISHDFYVGMTFGFFLGHELLALIDIERGNTFTEFTWWKLTEEGSRFAYGLAIAVLAFLRFPDPIAPWAAGILALWLPFHFAFPGFERRRLAQLKALLS